MSTQTPGQSALPPISGPPYVLPVAQLGGIPTPNPDSIISGVLLALFVIGAATHMTVFQINQRREHKFIFSVLLFGFCMARIVALVMRIVFASRPGNINISIAANVFVAAGVLLLFIVNLLFSQRIVRAYHPKFGWSKVVTLGFRFLFFSVIALLIMVVITSVHSFFTLDMAVRMKERDVARFAGTYLAVLAFLPLPIVILAVLFPRSEEKKTRIDKFGEGRLRTKVGLLLFTSTLLALGAGFRVGVNFSTPRPIGDPAWYHSKACFYCFNFVIELIVVYAYAIARFDKRFHIPDGSSGPGHYTEKKGKTGVGARVNTESEVFGGDEEEEKEKKNGAKGTSTTGEEESANKVGSHDGAERDSGVDAGRDVDVEAEGDHSAESKRSSVQKPAAQGRENV